MSIPLNPSSEFPGGYSVQYGPPDNPQWRMEHPSVFGIEYAGVLGKVGFDSAAGWVAFSDAGWVFVHQFEVEPGSSYPDGGATVEVWTHGPGIAAGVDFGQEQLRGEFMEMEVLGPMVSLSPGEETSADLLWAACRCPGVIVDASPVSCTGQPLEVERHGDMAHLRGTFGIFAPGRVQLRVHSGLESEKASQVLLERPAGPREPVILDDHIALPEGTLELVVLDARGADSGTIAHAEVTR